MSEETLIVLSIFGCITLIACIKLICGAIEDSRRCRHEYENSEPILVDNCNILQGSFQEKTYRVIQTCKKCGHIQTVRIHKWGDKNDRV